VRAGCQGSFHGLERILYLFRPVGTYDIARVLIQARSARAFAGIVYQDACFHDVRMAEASGISDI
jgi:hypothetical protein